MHRPSYATKYLPKNLANSPLEDRYSDIDVKRIMITIDAIKSEFSALEQERNASAVALKKAIKLREKSSCLEEHLMMSLKNTNQQARKEERNLLLQTCRQTLLNPIRRYISELNFQILQAPAKDSPINSELDLKTPRDRNDTGRAESSFATGAGFFRQKEVAIKPTEKFYDTSCLCG